MRSGAATRGEGCCTVPQRLPSGPLKRTNGSRERLDLADLGPAPVPGRSGGLHRRVAVSCGGSLTAMTRQSGEAYSVGLLADGVHLVPTVAEIRWKEWGHPPEPTDLSWWVDVTRRESGRNGLPVTFVATDGRGEAAGAVGLGEFDIEERRDRSPWLLGMIVRQDLRGRGIGRLLLAHLQAWAGDHGYGRMWVATGGTAVQFYRACGWQVIETVQRTPLDRRPVLSRHL